MLNHVARILAGILAVVIGFVVWYILKAIWNAFGANLFWFLLGTYLVGWMLIVFIEKVTKDA